MGTLTLDPAQLDARTQTAAREAAKNGRLQNPPADVTMRIQGETIEIPPVLANAFFEVMQALVRGQTVSIATEEHELTTTEAADLLNVSRPHLVKLLKQGAIPFHRVGSHRRVYRSDVFGYKQAQREEAEDAMRALAQQAQEHDLGY